MQSDTINNKENEEPSSETPLRRKSYFKTIKLCKGKESIFSSKKLKRNGLLERKILKKNAMFKVGRWTKDEHLKFIEGCRLYGAQWKMVIKFLIFILKIIYFLIF